jgi:hypothetical protein
MFKLCTFFLNIVVVVKRARMLVTRKKVRVNRFCSYFFVQSVCEHSSLVEILRRNLILAHIPFILYDILALERPPVRKYCSITQHAKISAPRERHPSIKSLNSGGRVTGSVTFFMFSSRINFHCNTREDGVVFFYCCPLSYEWISDANSLEFCGTVLYDVTVTLSHWCFLDTHTRAHICPVAGPEKLYCMLSKKCGHCCKAFIFRTNTHTHTKLLTWQSWMLMSTRNFNQML